MKQKIILTIVLTFGILILTGCTKQISEIDQAVKKTNKDLSAARVEARDAKRISDVNILNTIVQIYIVDKKEIPTIKDGNGHYRSFKLIKNSSDFKTLESVIKDYDSSMYIPVDPSDPERYYEFYSDSHKYTIKAYLEENNGNCKQIRPDYCEFEIKGNIDSLLN